MAASEPFITGNADFRREKINMEAKVQTRNNYLDWLRVLGILLVFIYHSSRFYNVEDWTVKNEHLVPLGGALERILHLLHDAADVRHLGGQPVLRRRGKADSGSSSRTRPCACWFPLLVGDLTHAALQAYLDHQSHGLFSGTYFQFLPQYYHLDAIDLGRHAPVVPAVPVRIQHHPVSTHALAEG